MGHSLQASSPGNGAPRVPGAEALVLVEKETYFFSFFLKLSHSEKEVWSLG